jgi:hypothetical protein
VSILTTTGTPFVGYAQLTNASPGPKAFLLFVTMGQAAVSMPATMRAYITDLVVSSNDATAALVTFDSGGTTPTKFDSVYMSATQQLQPQEMPPGVLRGVFGLMPRIGATAVSGGATVEAIIYGYLSAS